MEKQEAPVHVCSWVRPLVMVFNYDVFLLQWAVHPGVGNVPRDMDKTTKHDKDQIMSRKSNNANASYTAVPAVLDTWIKKEEIVVTVGKRPDNNSKRIWD